MNFQNINHKIIIDVALSQFDWAPLLCDAVNHRVPAAPPLPLLSI